ncbi:hypothetical protein MFUL124B02_03180 [Myxococcus fulvus 124B02]|nr:hypothetical protein MFUL124B02_03180 [Myxococcus fulvus 124B02]
MMHGKRSGLAALLLLLSSTGWASEPSPPLVREWRYLMRLEVMTLAFLPRAGVGEDAGFLQVEPTFILDGGAELGLNLGAPVRFRLWDGDGGGAHVRREDWDTFSDWGQLVRGLKFGSDDAPLGVWFGPLEEHRLLSGHLVRRYSNRTNPDYHPAGGLLTGTLGPVYVEAFTSDALGARLMGAEVSLDVEHLSLPRLRGQRGYAAWATGKPARSYSTGLM